MNKEYKAGAFAHPAFGRFVTIMAALMVSLLFLLSRELALVASVVLLIAFMRLHHRRMVFSEDSFRYDGWLSSVRIPIDDVVGLKPASSFGYPVDRWHGGQLCILTDRRKFWVRPIWFGPQAMRDFEERLGQKGRTTRKKADPVGTDTSALRADVSDLKSLAKKTNAHH
jgi:hypothetical protein